MGRHFPGMLKEQCVKFPSGSSEISWFLNEDSGPMMMMMMNLVTNMMIMGRWDSWMVERNAELFGVSQSTDRKVSDQLLIQISNPPLVQNTKIKIIDCWIQVQPQSKIFFTLSE